MGAYDRQRVERLLQERSQDLRQSRDPGLRDPDSPNADLDGGWERMIDRELERVDAARMALEDGTYGTCVDCDAEIPPGRMAVVPEAVRCIECQRRHEAG